MGMRRAPIALLLAGSLWGGAASAADVVAKDRFLLGSHLGYARLVLSLKPPHPRYEAVRLDPRDQHPGEHIPYVLATLALRHQETGEEQRLLLLPAMTPFYQYGGLLRLPRPSPYEFTLTLDPLAIPGVREPAPVTFRYRYEWTGPGGGGTR